MSRLRACALGLLIVLVASCTSGSGGDGAAGTAADVDSVRSMAAMAMAEVDTLRFTIELEGADVFIDDDELIQFQAAEGRYAAPGSADAVISVTALGLATEVGAIAIDGEVWITNPLTGEWEAAPESISFDPATIFDSAAGLSSLIADGLSDAVLESPGPTDGRFHITAAVAPERVSTLTGGLVDDVDSVDLWVDEDTGRIGELRFDVGSGADGTSWRLLLTDYGASVTVNEPELG